MKAPCKGCERRKLLCHGACREFQEWKQAHEEALARRNRIKESEWTVSRNGEKMMNRAKMNRRR